MNSVTDDFFTAKESISDTRSIIEIKQQYVFSGKTLHVFVEANDDYEFYRKSLEMIYNGFKIIHYPKKGKDNVLNSYKVLNWSSYNKSRILFFVDKDYEEILGYSSKLDRNIFVTKFYSIENYLSSIDVFRYIVENIFKISQSNLIVNLLKSFENSYKVFERQLLYLTAIIIIYRRASIHISLENIKMDDFFVFQNLDIYLVKYKKPQIFEKIKKSNVQPLEKRQIKCEKTIKYIQQAGADATMINYKTVLNNVKELKKNLDSRTYIRGKYHLWFLIQCCSKIHSMSRSINIEIQKNNEILSEHQKSTKVNTSIIINESNIFDLLPMKLHTHNDVNIFLISNFQKLNA